MIITLSIFTVIYCFILIRLIGSWERISYVERSIVPDKLPFISVIIPVRNEASNILNLLIDLKNQNYPKDLYEVIVVNDDSVDDTVKIIEENKEALDFDIKVLHLIVEPQFTGSHKKRALSLGISKSKGDYILATDGDCRVASEWISTLGAYTRNLEYECITGPVTFHSEESLFGDFQVMEFAFLIGTGASSLNLGFPNMCNGANLAFSKKAFLEVRGYEGNSHIPSGDDEFLMHKIYRKYPDKVRFLKSKDFLVTTFAKANIKELFFQRKRWAGKWKMYKDIRISIAAAFYFLYSIALTIAFFMAIAGIYPVWVFCLQLALRLIFDAIFVKKIMRFLDKKFSYPKFFLAAIIYPLYVIVLGIAANFGYYEWKGRKGK